MTDRHRTPAGSGVILALLAIVALLLAGCSSLAPQRTPVPTDPFDVVVDVFVAIPDGWAGDTMQMEELPPEALETLELVRSRGPFPYRQDDGVFQNREGLLPDRPMGTYREYTVETPGSPDRGARRLVIGDGRDVWYTDDHYDSFRFVIP